MMIIGCDLHTRYQQVAMLDTESGELVERRLEHESGEARTFYAALAGRVRVGIEATGHTHWFEAMLAEMGHELWMGDAAKIRAAGGWPIQAVLWLEWGSGGLAHPLPPVSQPAWVPCPYSRSLRIGRVPHSQNGNGHQPRPLFS